MNILVTGGAGYIGSILVPMLLAEGHRVLVLDNLTYSGQPLLGVWTHPRFKFKQGDIRDRETLSSMLDGMESVVHLAAIVGDPACARQSRIAREINLDASLQLFKLSQRQGITRFIFASTCSNYGKMSDPSQYATETSELRPVSLYAETKVAVEKALLNASVNERPAVTVLRFATVFGLSPRMRFDLTVNEFTMELLTKRALLVYGEQFWRPYIHVWDAARAIAMVLDAPLKKVSDQVFNVGDTNQNYQKGQLVELIRAQLKHEVEIQHMHKEEDPRDYRVSFEKIKRELDFHVTRTIEDGVREIIDAIEQGVITDFDKPHYRN